MRQKANKNKMMTKTDFEEEFEDNWSAEERREEAALPDPEDDEADDTDDDTDEAYELVKEINDLSDDLPEEAEEFGSSVCEKANAIQVTIEENERVTSGQLTALKNMKRGMEKWIR